MTGDAAKKLQEVSNEMAKVNRNTKKTADTLGSLKTAFVGYFGALGVREITQFSDRIQLLRNRISVFEGGVDAGNKVLERLADVAEYTKSPLTDIATAYGRLSVSVDRTIVSSEALIGITKTLQGSFVLSGSTAAEATGALIQLSQAFQTGAVRGQELRSVLEGNGILAKILNDRYKEFGGALKAGEKGLITTADFLQILYENFDQINKQVATLEPTFGQTMANVFTQLSLQVLSLNDALGLSKGFAYVMDYLIKRLPLLISAIGILALTMVPALTLSITALGRAIALAFASNPLGAALIVITPLILALIPTTDQLTQSFRKIAYNVLELTDAFFGLGDGIASFLGLSNARKNLEELRTGIRGTMEGIKNDYEKLQKEMSITPEQRLAEENEKQKKALQDSIEGYRKLLGNGGKEKKIKEILGEINQEFLKGAISAEQYAEKLNSFNMMKLNREFREGKFTLEQYNESLRAMSQVTFNKALNDNVIDLQEYRDLVSSIKIDKLNEDLNQGRISLIEYDMELSKLNQKFSAGGAFRSGLQGYLESIGTTTEGIAGVISGAFSSVEQGIAEMVVKGKADFKSLAEGIMIELTRIVIRAMVLKPILDSFLNGTPVNGAGLGGGGGAAPAPATRMNMYAKGGAFSNGSVVPFAKGGVVNSPTMFNYGSKTGVMGEAGPEAILPLRRTSGGDLGVMAQTAPVNIQVINNSNASVSSQETTGPDGSRQIKFMIQGAVQEAISNGSLDRSMRSSYGVTRRGY